MDAMLPEKGDEVRFREIYEPICDMINIETLVPLVKENDISKLKTEFKNGYWKNEIHEQMICSQPFYVLVITPDGNVLPCCEADGDNLKIGNINEQSLKEIWNGICLNNLRKLMICGKRKELHWCRECGVVKYQTSEADMLDEYREQLEQLY